MHSMIVCMQALHLKQEVFYVTTDKMYVAMLTDDDIDHMTVFSSLCTCPNNWELIKATSLLVDM